MTQLRFLTDIPLAWPALAVLATAAAAWWLAFRESRDLSPPKRWLLPTLRATAVALIVSMLLEPSLHHRVFLGEPSRLRVWLDASESMRETDVTVTAESGAAARNRYQRSVHLLAGGDIPLLETWSEQGHVEVRSWSGSESALLWRSAPTEEMPPLPPDDAWLPEAWSRGTSLAVPLTASVSEAEAAGGAAEGQDEQASAAETLTTVQEPVLLLTDGRHNEGASPLELLAAWETGTETNRFPVWIVGMGSEEPPPRMTIRGVTMPAELFRSDRLEGRIELADHRPAGEAWQLSVSLDEPGGAGPTLWSQRVVSSREGFKEVAFGFALEPVVKSLVARSVPGRGAASVIETLAVPLRVEIEPVASNTALAAGAEGHRSRHLVGVTTRRQRVLLLDGRSRWETRYLRNALERDPRWEVDAFLMPPRQSPLWFAQQAEPRPFPTTAEGWLEYDLVITGEIEPTAEGVDALRFLREAVERGGTGWVVIDGQRETWGRAEFARLREMLPVQRQPVRGVEQLSGTTWKAVVSDQASDLGAVQLGDGSPASSRSTWDRLPGVVNLVPTRLLPGGESVVEAARGAVKLPLISTRLYGGGRVIHLATDETWRWRYEVADEIHQRFWNQLARYAMRMPFAVRNEYAALDSGDVAISAGQPVAVRALLKDSRGLPSEAALVRAVASRDGRVVSVLSLSADPVLPGLFRGQWEGLSPGTYEVRLEATGFPAEALALATSVQIVAPPSAEEIDVTRNDEMLRQIAERTGGRYVPEGEASQLWEQIALERTGRVVETHTELWQSGWWLALATAVLGVEWWLRKKAGLI
jgi:hypothetical protein